MSEHNPFQPPTAPLQEPLIAGAPSGEPLYKMSAVSLATFLGTPLAGAWIMVRNLRALGRVAEIRRVWGIGVVLVILVAVLGVVLPDGVPSSIFVVAQVVSMQAFARQTFEPAVRAHEAAGRPMHSNWRAAGVAALFLFGFVAVIVAVVGLLLVIEAVS